MAPYHANLSQCCMPDDPAVLDSQSVSGAAVIVNSDSVSSLPAVNSVSPSSELDSVSVSSSTKKRTQPHPKSLRADPLGILRTRDGERAMTQPDWSCRTAVQSDERGRSGWAIGPTGPSESDQTRWPADLLVRAAGPGERGRTGGLGLRLACRRPGRAG
jgi:hypothetical protein